MKKNLPSKSFCFILCLFLFAYLSASCGDENKKDKTADQTTDSDATKDCESGNSRSCIDNVELLKNVSIPIIENVTNQWTDLNENENYTARHECSFVQAGNQFIMFGGRESAQKLDIYDFKANTWSTGAPAPKEFNHFQATEYKGFVWVIGSFKTNKFPNEVPEENVWLYSPAFDKWIKGPEIPEGRRRGGAGLTIYNNKFYLIGGNTIGHNGGYVNWFDEYDPWTNTWTELANASEQRDHFAAASIGTKLYAAGGRRSGGEGGVFAPVISTVEVYDFLTKKWSILENDLPTPRAGTSTVVFNNELYIIGGEGGGMAYKTVEAYNPQIGNWSGKADLNFARHGTQAIASGNGIFIAGGSFKQGGGNQKNMEVYSGDSAKGAPIIISSMMAPEQICIKANTKDSLAICNVRTPNVSGSFSAYFIESVSIEGGQKDKFEILSKLNLTLLDANSSTDIVVKHNGEEAGNEAMLKIIYNGGLEKTIQLVSN